MKNLNLFYFVLFILSFFNSCIEKYSPVINSSDQAKYVVSGKVTNHEGLQTIMISKTSPVGSYENIPVSGCKVDIMDNLGNSFSLTESIPGKYCVWMNRTYLNPGTSYKLNIITPNGMILESDYDKMSFCPKIDSAYFLKEDPSPYYNDPNFETTEGIQFYIDFTGSETDSRFLNWEIEETWEYHSQFTLFEYIDMEGPHLADPDDYSKFFCWKTQFVNDIFTLSTDNLSQNSYKQFPLHFVDNHSSRLEYGYYLLIKQYAISESAYTYWEQQKLNSSNQGGLYEKQPLPIVGNIYNITNPDQEVLGFFEASSFDSIVLFIKDVENLNLEFNSFCSFLSPLPGIPKHPQNPIYFTNANGVKQRINLECWDCLSRGGINIKPDFWPL